MKKIYIIGFVVLVLLASSIPYIACSGGCSDEPIIGNRVAFRPDISQKSGEKFSAGTCFVTQTGPDSQPIMITALHIFGPDGGLPEHIASEDLSTKIGLIYLKPLDDAETSVGFASESLVSTGYPWELDDVSGDLAVFKLFQGKENIDILYLAKANPKSGDNVWIVGDKFNSYTNKQRLWPAIVIQVTPRYIALELLKDLDISGFSGAPVINCKKEIVGMLTSIQSGLVYIVSVANIRHHLKENQVK